MLFEFGISLLPTFTWQPCAANLKRIGILQGALGNNKLTWLVLGEDPAAQLALIGSNSSLHAEVCNALGASDGVIHSRISQEVVQRAAVIEM